MSFASWLKQWRHLTKRRRLSFYESQHAMRRATETAGPVDMSWLTEDALTRIVKEEAGTLRAEMAHYWLEQRARERLAAALPHNADTRSGTFSPSR